MFPGYYIPPLSKKTKVKHFDETHLNKRLRVFENFINYILKSKILSYTTYVSDFLSITEDGLFSARKRDGDNKQAPKNVSQYQTLDGKIYVKIDNEIKNYADSYGLYQSNLDLAYNDIKKNSKQLFLDFDSLSSSLLKIGDNLAHMAESTAMFSK